MTSTVWLPREMRSILLGILNTQARHFAHAGTESPDEEEQAYLDGCRSAVESLLLAFGIPLPAAPLGSTSPEVPDAVSLSHDSWVPQDMANILNAMAFSASSGPWARAAEGAAGAFHRGFMETLQTAAQAFGIPLAAPRPRQRKGAPSFLFLDE